MSKLADLFDAILNPSVDTEFLIGLVSSYDPISRYGLLESGIAFKCPISLNIQLWDEISVMRCLGRSIALHILDRAVNEIVLDPIEGLEPLPE